MSLDFTANTNRVVASANVAMGAVASGGGWHYPTSMGTSNLGSFMSHGSSTTLYRYLLAFNGTASSNKLKFSTGRATQDGGWEMTTGFASLSRWRWFGWTYNTGNVANHPIFYLLDQGVWSVLTNGAGITLVNTPSGTLDADTQPTRMGNGSGGISQWLGYLAHGFWYNRILTESEMRMVAERGPRRVPRGLMVSWPGLRFNTLTLKDESGAARDGTASGTGAATSMVEHPPARW